MLPASTGERTQRGVSRGRPDGRTVEIQRLIGRALRAVCDFEALGERTLWLDCDVLQADGGTRCASITGAYVAAARALDRFGLSKALPGAVAAVSVGVVDGVAVLDLDYPEDAAGRDGHERRDDGRRSPRRGAGDGRAGAVLARAPRRAPRPRRRGDRAASGWRRPTRPRPRAREGATRVPQPAQAGRAQARAPGVGARRSPTLRRIRRRPGSTYLENARAKARHALPFAPPGAWVIGEDSGIEVRALGGAPGLHSARWAEDGVGRLLERLDGVDDRAARYVCVLVAVSADGRGARRRGSARGPRSRGRRGAAGASATTPSSSPPARR